MTNKKQKNTGTKIAMNTKNTKNTKNKRKLQRIQDIKKTKNTNKKNISKIQKRIYTPVLYIYIYQEYRI